MYILISTFHEMVGVHTVVAATINCSETVTSPPPHQNQLPISLLQQPSSGGRPIRRIATAECKD